MKNCRTTAVVNLRAGNVRLNRDQYRRRQHLVESVKGDIKKSDEAVFKIVQPIQFKAGEEFGFDGDIPKVGVELVDGCSATKKDRVAPSAESGEADGGGDEVGPYDDMNRNDLKAELQARGIEYNGRGSNAEWIELLEADDAENADQ